MDQVDLIRAVLLAIPAALLIGLLLPDRLPLRPVWSLVAGGVIAFGMVAFLGPGQLAYVVSFSVMATIYAVLSLALNTQWGYNGHLNFGIAGFFAVGAFTYALFTTEMPEGLAADYSHQAFGLSPRSIPVAPASTAMISALSASAMRFICAICQSVALAVVPK
jgi:branched-chain amino acid transport system permease protein